MEKGEKIRKAFIEYVLENGTRPASIFQFAKKLKMTEAEFYDFYNSFDQLEADIWRTSLDETIAKIEAEEVYAQYSVREKLLALYYTWFETLKAQRSFVLKTFPDLKKSGMKTPSSLETLKTGYYNFVTELMMEAKETKEVVSRRFVDERYPQIFWLQALWLLDFWVKDTSKGFEKTDSAIEKTVNTSFDLIGASALDSVIDLAKFMFQNR
jgi:hypothetical protein